MVKTLYEICLYKLIINFESVEDLQYVPFDPFIKDILNYLIVTDTTSENKQLSKIILKKIGESQGQQLQKKEYLHFGSFNFKYSSPHQVAKEFKNFIQSAPQFITRLDLSMVPLSDDDLVHIKLLTNLVVLDLTNTLITDIGMSNLAQFTQPNNISRIALPHLKILSVAYCQYITDRSLRYIPKMKRSLIGIDLSTTMITPVVANTFLLQHGYQQISKQDMILINNNNTMNKNENDKDSITAALLSPRFDFLNTILSLDPIENSLSSAKHYIREKIKRQYCPQHSLSLISYFIDGSKDSLTYRLFNQYRTETKWLNNETFNPGYEIQQNEQFNELMNNNLVIRPRDNVLNDSKSWKAWWWKNNKQQKELVFLLKPSIKDQSSKDKKRTLELDQDNNNNNKINNKEKSIKKKRGLQVKQSMDATTFLQNFQL